ncbi:MAG: loop repeat protein [Hyphomicrobiales bacterium]|nr:loop repeat protein [Hyphomicrobiales bacterium]
MFETIIGGLAAFCTTISYVPQVKKAWETHETGDISMKMLLLLSAGLALWIVYGFMRSDWVIIVANGLSLAMLSNLVWFKMREKPAKKS